MDASESLAGTSRTQKLDEPFCNLRSVALPSSGKRPVDNEIGELVERSKLTSVTLAQILVKEKFRVFEEWIPSADIKPIQIQPKS